MLRITVNEKSLARVAGLACNRAWAYSCFFGLSLFARPETGSSSYQLMLYLGSAFILTITLALAATFHKRIEAFLSRPQYLMVGPALASIGSLLIPFIGVPGIEMTESIMLVVISNLLTGVGSGLLLLSWGISYANADSEQMPVESCAAFVGGVMLYALFSMVLPVAHFAFVIALPLASALFCRHANSLVADNMRETPRFGKDSGLPRVAAGILLFGFVAGITRDIQPLMPSSDSSTTYSMTVFLTTAFVVFAFYALTRKGSSLDINALFRPTLVVMMLGILFMPLFSESSLAPAALVKSGYTCFELLVWIMLARFCHQKKASPVIAFGIGRAVVAGSGVLGSLVAVFVLPIVQQNNVQTALVFAILAIALVILCNTILTTENFSKLWRTNDKEPSKLSFEQRCNVVFDRYGLSPRQREIAFMIACGHDSNYISEKLYISKGTINSHRMRIYKKLGVHSRQELLDLIPQAEELGQKHD